MLIMRFPSVFLQQLYLHIIIGVGGVCCDGEKMTRLEAVCAADSDWNSAEALDCSQASCLSINPRHTLQLWPHWASIAAVIQLPGRETRTASQADNNWPRLENSGLLLWCQQSIFLSLLAGHHAAGGPLSGLFPGSKLYLESIFCCYRKQFWISSCDFPKDSVRAPQKHLRFTYGSHMKAKNRRRNPLIPILLCPSFGRQDWK